MFFPKVGVMLPTADYSAFKSVYVDMIEEFSERAAVMLEEKIREILGNEYKLGRQFSHDYLAKKLRLPFIKIVPGKTFGQPLILTGKGIYDNIVGSYYTGNNPFGASLAHGFEVVLGDLPSGEDFDYPNYWAEVTGFIDKAYAEIEPDLAKMLEDMAATRFGMWLA